MAYESTAEPIKLGYLFDFVLPDGYPAEMRADLTNAFDLVFEDGLAQGVIDRPVEIIFREVEGLPKGSVKKVIDAYGELVDEGCLAIFGPSITDNCVPMKEAIEERFKVPTISVTGTEEWLGEWTFSLSMGSMTDEPIFWAQLIAERGLNDVGVLVEQSLVGEHYITSFQNAWINKIVWDAIVGWTGLDQYDDGNAVGQAFLDRYNERYGRRPTYCVPVVNRDLATVLLHAFADARPLSPRGVRDALERIRLVPAASGSPGTRISFGKYAHRGWMGTGYLVARRLDEDGVSAHLVERFTDS